RRDARGERAGCGLESRGRNREHPPLNLRPEGRMGRRRSCHSRPRPRTPEFPRLSLRTWKTRRQALAELDMVDRPRTCLSFSPEEDDDGQDNTSPDDVHRLDSVGSGMDSPSVWRSIWMGVLQSVYCRQSWLSVY